MHRANSFPFPRLRLWLFDLIHRRPATLLATEVDGIANVARAQERQRLSQPLPNVPASSPTVASTWVAHPPPTVTHLSSEPPQRAMILSPRQRAIRSQMRLEQSRHLAGLAQSVQMDRAARLAQYERIPTLRQLPTPAPAVSRLIDDVRRETPPERPAWNWRIEPDEDEDATLHTLDAMARRLV